MSKEIRAAVTVITLILALVLAFLTHGAERALCLLAAAFSILAHCYYVDLLAFIRRVQEHTASLEERLLDEISRLDLAADSLRQELRSIAAELAELRQMRPAPVLAQRRPYGGPAGILTAVLLLGGCALLAVWRAEIGGLQERLGQSQSRLTDAELALKKMEDSFARTRELLARIDQDLSMTDSRQNSALNRAQTKSDVGWDDWSFDPPSPRKEALLHQMIFGADGAEPVVTPQ